MLRLAQPRAFEMGSQVGLQLARLLGFLRKFLDISLLREYKPFGIIT
jgi:hypothetical protein